MIYIRGKEAIKELGERLLISSGGYEGIGYTTPVIKQENIKAFFANSNYQNYCEVIILPDGRVVPAQPSHSIVMDSLLNFLAEGEFTLSFSWLVEERLYYTGAIMVWNSNQTAFGNITEDQQRSLDILEELNLIQQNLSVYPESKQNFFSANAESIHEEALEWQAKTSDSKLLFSLSDIS